MTLNTSFKLLSGSNYVIIIELVEVKIAHSIQVSLGAVTLIC